MELCLTITVIRKRPPKRLLCNTEAKMSFFRNSYFYIFVLISFIGHFDALLLLDDVDDDEYMDMSVVDKLRFAYHKYLLKGEEIIDNLLDDIVEQMGINVYSR